MQLDLQPRWSAAKTEKLQQFSRNKERLPNNEIFSIFYVHVKLENLKLFCKNCLFNSSIIIIDLDKHHG